MDAMTAIPWLQLVHFAPVLPSPGAPCAPRARAPAPPSAGIRILTGITYIATIGAGGWGFLLANARFQTSYEANNGTSQISLDNLDLLQKNVAVFQGLMALYYW